MCSDLSCQIIDFYIAAFSAFLHLFSVEINVELAEELVTNKVKRRTLIPALVSRRRSRLPGLCNNITDDAAPGSRRQEVPNLQ